MNYNLESAGSVSQVEIARPEQRRKSESFYLGGMLLAGHVLLLWRFVKDPWTRACYVLPFVVAGGIYLFWQRWSRMEKPEYAPDYKAGGWLLVGGWMVLVVATFLGSPWLGLVAFLLSLSGYAFLLGGKAWFRCWAPLLLLLCVFLRPPIELDLPELVPLAFLQTTLAGDLLDRLGVLNVVSGSLIEIPGRQIWAHLVFNGVAVKLVLAGAALFIGLQRGRPWWRIGCLVGGLFLFLGLNESILLVACVFSDDKLGVNPLLGLGRWVMVLLNVTVTLGLVISLDHFLNGVVGFFRRPDPGLAARASMFVVGMPENPEAAAAPKPDIATRWHQLQAQLRALGKCPVPWWGWGLGLLFCLIGMVQLLWAQVYVNDKQDMASTPQTNLVIQMPEQIGDWVKLASPQTNSVKSTGSTSTNLAWTYQWGEVKANITLSYPFSEFAPAHEVIRSTGWQVNNYQMNLNNVAAQNQPYVEAQMSQPPAQSAILMEACFTPQAQWLKPKVFHWVQSQIHWLGSPVTAFRLRLLANEYLPMKPNEVAEVRSLFFAARNHVVTEVLNRSGGKP